MSALSQAAAGLANNESVSFGQVTNNLDQLPDAGGPIYQWAIRFAYDTNSPAAHICNKGASSTRRTRLLRYDVTTDIWSVLADGFLGDSGHCYDGFTVDTESGEPYFHRWNNNSLQKWNGTVWETININPTLNVHDGAGTLTTTAFAFHPNLFGPGLKGIIWCNETNVNAIRLSDLTGISLGTRPVNGGIHPLAFYSPAHDAVFVGGGNSTTQLLKVTPGALPTVSIAGNAPTPIGSSETQTGVWPSPITGDKRLFIFDNPGIQYWVSEDDGQNWTAVQGNPFPGNLGSYLVTTIPEEGVFWGLGPGWGRLWRPTASPFGVEEQQIIVDSAITQSTIQADGRRWIRERHTDHLGNVHEIEYRGNSITPQCADKIKARLKAREIGENLNRPSLGSWELTYVTIDEMRQALREAYQGAVGEEAAKLARLVSELSDALITNLFGAADPAPIKTKAQGLASDYVTVTTAVGD